MYKFGFIGVGNMGSAMLRGCLSAFSAEQIAFSDNDKQKAEQISEDTGVICVSTADCVAQSEFIVLAVKPQVYPVVLPQIASLIDCSKVVISLAPSFCIADVKKYLGAETRIVRAMPNTPACICAGMTGICFSDDIYTDDEKKTLDVFFTSFGRVEVVSENLMGAVTGASGSSPAFVYMMIEALADGVVAYGMPRDKAYKFVAQAVYGSAKMVLDTGRHPGQLKDAVCSPAGTTIAGVASLERNGFRSSLIDAVSAVCDKCMNM